MFRPQFERYRVLSAVCVCTIDCEVCLEHVYAGYSLCGG
jgi:hypothetical protein